MNHPCIRLYGVAALLLAPLAQAQTKIMLDQPIDWQVCQRTPQEWADIKVTGSASADAALVEAKADLSSAMRGKASDWTIIAQGPQIKDGKFAGSIKLPTGGWYALQVRIRKSAADPAVLAEGSVAHVGVGDIFVVAGQSNSS
ncbi:MAG: hypothetical protein WCJ66_19320, partial [Verrucomicrobiota bacterium]